MKRFVTALTVAGLALPLFAIATPAEAGHKRHRNSRWVAGADFRVGGVSFTVGFHSPERYRHNFRPRYYYRTTRPLRYDGYKCTSACYLKDRYHHHDRSCPVVRYHLGRYDFDPYPMWDYVTWNRGGYGRYSDDRYYGNSRRRGYYRHDRYRGHRHSSRCRH